ncbi:hypothetical protein EVAR_11159_1 [Eumeta japonica]|uniref:Uncharacterized protein n=1 Tax=Eumeta variegata TaxID=151549 RepID=A0A4C1U4E3_EUMVA|nr:hypothetical protein EVAR_11159_1 [Eumeta japonica]
MHPPAYMSCIHFHWGGVAMHFAFFMRWRSFTGLLYTAAGAGSGMSLWLEPGLHLGRDTALSGFDMPTYRLSRSTERRVRSITLCSAVCVSTIGYPCGGSSDICPCRRRTTTSTRAYAYQQVMGGTRHEERKSTIGQAVHAADRRWAADRRSRHR